jgi:hypothetical protein
MVSYYGLITVGDEKYQALFDSGSEDVFLFDESCSSRDCLNHKKYKKSKNYRFISKG